MNRKTNTCQTNQPGKQLKERESFHRVRPLTRLWIVVLFLALGAALPLSRSVQAQGLEGHHPASKALKARTGRTRIVRSRSKTQNADGVIITAKQAKLRPGYKFIKLDNNTIAVERKKGGGRKVIRCGCDPGNAAHFRPLRVSKISNKGAFAASGGCAITWNAGSDVAFCQSQGCEGKCAFK
jgi:hypothetical protein